MEKLSSYKKVQIILLVLIIIASIVFIISIGKAKERKLAKDSKTIETATIAEKVENEDEVVVEENNEEETENPEDTSWDEDAEDTKVENPEEEEKESKETYYLKVNYGANVVTAYKKDSSGKYTIPVKAMVCSTGKATPTSGTYKMSNKYRWHQLNGGVYGQYCSRITGHILFHSVPYAKNTPDSLKYTAYDKLGTKASAGCIRLTVADALWIYNNCQSGTYVEFYSSSDPGPLGKPSAQKISSNEKCRNWDPTDPLSNNPWKSYVEPASTTVEKPQENKNDNQSKKDEPKKDENQKQNETKQNTTNTNSTSNTVNNTTSGNNTANNNTSEDNTSNTNTSQNVTAKNNVTE